MWLVWLASLATASDLSPWVGSWGLDPSQSDDALQRVQMAVRAPILDASGARQLSPDGSGQVDQEDHQRRVVGSVMRLLGHSGIVEWAEGSKSDVVRLTLGGDPPQELSDGRKWTKVKTDEGRYRVRVQLGERLVLQRRADNLTVTETFLDPSDDGSVAVVVRLEGSGLQEIEFRRVYRPLDR